jgi:hypothetical protein
MMQDIKKHKIALSLIALLLIIKFVFVPVFEWQNETLLEVDLLQKQVSRIDNVLNNRQEIESYGDSLANSLAFSSELFLVSSDVSTFELEQQQWLELKIGEYELIAKNIGWSPSQKHAGSNLVAHNVQLNIDGNTSNIIKFIQDLQSQKYYIGVQAFNIRFKSQSGQSLGTGVTRLNLIFYRQEEPA